MYYDSILDCEVSTILLMNLKVFVHIEDEMDVVGRQWQKGKHTFRMGLLYDKSNLYWEKDFGSGELLYISKSSNPIQVYSTYSLDLSSLLSSDLTLQIGMMTQSFCLFFLILRSIFNLMMGTVNQLLRVSKGMVTKFGRIFPNGGFIPFFKFKATWILCGNVSFYHCGIVCIVGSDLSYEDKSFDVPIKDPKDCTPESNDIFCEEVQWRGDGAMYVSTSTTLYEIRENNRLEQVAKFSRRDGLIGRTTKLLIWLWMLKVIFMGSQE